MSEQQASNMQPVHMQHVPHVVANAVAFVDA